MHEHVGLVDDADDALTGHHRQLADVVELHALVGHGESVVGRHHHRVARGVGAHDQIAQIAVSRTLEEAVVEHPVVVVHLREVLVAGVAHEGEHPLRLGLLAAVTQGGGDQGAGGGAAEDAFLAEQHARGVEALRIRDRIGLLHPAEIRDRGDEILPDALHQPGAGFLRHPAFVDPLGEDRPHRIGEDDLELRSYPREEARKPGDRARGAAADDDRIEPLSHLAPDLGSSALLVRARIVGVAELIDEEAAGRLPGDARGQVLIVLGMPFLHVRAGEHHLGTHRLEVEDLLPAHLVRHDEDEAVAFLACDQGQCQSRIAGGAFDQRRAWLQPPITLGGLDHRKTDAVLNRAAGILRFELEEKLARAAIEASYPDDRRLADQLEDRFVNHPLPGERWAKHHNKTPSLSARARGRKRGSEASASGRWEMARKDLQQAVLRA